MDKLGFEPPQEQWLGDPQVKRMIDESREKLVSERLTTPGKQADAWQCLMAAKLFEFTAAFSGAKKGGTSSIEPYRTGPRESKACYKRTPNGKLGVRHRANLRAKNELHLG
ncbi:MAG: hypothetical protein AABN33_06490 [Acidobacteriota bacterium]